MVVSLSESADGLCGQPSIGSAVALVALADADGLLLLAANVKISIPRSEEVVRGADPRNKTIPL
jgi:hypothetical protein